MLSPTPNSDAQELARLVAGDHPEPHQLMGSHPESRGGKRGVIIRAMHPDAVSAEALLDGVGVLPMAATPQGSVFEAFAEGCTPRTPHRIRFRFRDGTAWTAVDPYQFLPTVGELDLHLFNEGTHRRLWRCFGANPRTIDGVDGVAFAVWAPSARRVSVIGDFCGWDGRRLPMRQMGSSGVFELFVPYARIGDRYKFEIKTPTGELRLKTDPLARCVEPPPDANGRIVQSRFEWSDHEWMSRRFGRDWSREPVNIYEAHLGSWMRVPEEGHRPLTYREIAPRLVSHVKRLGFTHIELLPVAEHPFGGSWGYQVTGYFAPTLRHGDMDGLKFLVDLCHRNGIGVIMDWVAAHFPKDDFALRRFDGTALYEHDDPRLGEHPDWGTLIFNYGRHEVRSFLISNALYWLDEFHMDGLRVDAVASMLYLDYSRAHGEWLPNRYGGKENIEAIEFLRQVNDAIAQEHPGCMTVAEESTAWPGVTRPASDGGLGFTFKWNMGWMHDTLTYFSKDPVHRRFHHDQLTFAMLYEYSERFVMPLSHDEVVHGKQSLLEKMPGDLWQRFANLRLLLLYQYTRPGKKLLFMGTEIAPYSEWYYDTSLDWHLGGDDFRSGLSRFMESLGHLYNESPALWRCDHDPTGFGWIDCQDRDQSVVSYWRKADNELLLVVLNLTPVPRPDYRIGAPVPGGYARVLSSDDPSFAGSQWPRFDEVWTEPVPMHGHAQSLRLSLPPLGGLVLRPLSL